MELQHLAIRELIKNLDDDTARISSQQALIDHEHPMAAPLAEALLNAFGRRPSQTHGAFNDENRSGYPFIASFEAFAQSPERDTFEPLVEQAMAQLAAAISSAPAATGGYVIFAAYEQFEQDYLLIALVRDKAGIAFNENLEPTEVQEVDLDRLHQAACINISSFKQQLSGYLSFIGSKEKGDVTHYFTHALGCTDVTPARKATGDLIQAANDYCQQAGLTEKREEVVGEVVNYLEKQRSDKKTANLNEVQQLFDVYIPPEQAETAGGTFGNFATGGEYQVSHEFKPHTSTINNYSKLKAKTRDWQLELGKRVLGEPGSNRDVIFDADTGSLTFKRLPPNLVDQLNAILQGED